VSIAAESQDPGRRQDGRTFQWGSLLLAPGSGCYALANACTHQRGPLCRGTLSARLTASEPGATELDDETPVLACPWHGWQFDVRTGPALWDERYAVHTYEARVGDGRALVEPGGRR
jgi:nitrite reductase/ring-hydroxylating ferredoxin subunit